MQLVAPPVFVGGLNRSGTTLMARILGSSSALAVAPSEFLFFGRRAHEEPADRADFERRLVDILGWPRVREWGLDERDILARSRSWPVSARSLFLLPLDAYRGRIGKQRIGEKSVLNEFRRPVFHAWFGDFRLVQMVRDPLEAYASGHQHLPPNVRRAVRWARLWRRSATLGLVGTHDDPERHRLVRYEDVRAEPSATVARVAAFLGIPFEEEAMLSLAAYDAKENSSFPASAGGTYELAIRQIDGVDRRAVVDPRERAAIATVCRRIASSLGYDVGGRSHRFGVAAARVAENVRPRHRLRVVVALLS
jgi:hypothetical protein